MARSYDYLLLGGGTSCGYAAGSIRELDKESSMGIVSADKFPPYDRPPFSKGFLTNDEMKPEDASAKEDSFYKDNNIDLILNTKAVALDRENHRVALETGEEIIYNKLLYALGSSPKPIPVEGSERIMLLRTASDSEKIREASKSAKVAVIIGGGYIGAEVAASLRKRGLEVTIVEAGPMLWARFPSKNIAAAIQKYLQEIGCEVITQDTVSRVKDGAVETKSGRLMNADMIIAGIGIEKNLDIAKRAGLPTDEKGVLADSTLRTSDADIWVAGDVAYFDDVICKGTYSAEHHLHAKWTGEHAGRCMAGETNDYKMVPYFFSDVGELSMILRGYPERAAKSYLFGDANASVLTEVFLFGDGKIDGVIDLRKDYKEQEPLSELFERLVLQGAYATPLEQELEKREFDITKFESLLT
ncbi:MAG TPA: FAD/NAD(P)-binding oxidoreductase [Fimbriimonadales bacterium]|nr:FAD/NAD(P)-binding oxidoreductase [Fimbriimonadales bacterium]